MFEHLIEKIFDRRPGKLAYGTIVLFMLIAAATLIGVPLFGYLHGFSLFDWILLGILYPATGMGITVGYHRLTSHRSFECRPWVKACLLVAGGWALQNSALRWASDHIRHHAKCDEEEDPYNAKKGFWHSHCGWLFVYTAHRDPKYRDLLRQDPVVMWQHRWYVPVFASGLVFPFAAGMIINGGWMGGWSCFLLAGAFRVFLVLNSTFCINSLCHLWGEQPHSTGDSSRDSWFVSLFTFGEGYHNYHHTYLRDYRNGPHWYNFDPSKWLIFGLSFFGLAGNLQRQKF